MLTKCLVFSEILGKSGPIPAIARKSSFLAEGTSSRERDFYMACWINCNVKVGIYRLEQETQTGNALEVLR